MPKCKLCGNKFSTRIEIDGIIRHLGHRKYCLDCHHFNYIKPKNKLLQTRSNTQEYRTKYQNKLRISKRQALIKCFGEKCRICSYSKNIKALHFHHLFDKIFNLTSSNMSIKQNNEIAKEACKTVILCSNCHAETHDGENSELMDSIKQELEQNFASNVKEKQKLFIEFLASIHRPRELLQKNEFICCYCKNPFSTKQCNRKFCSLECSSKSQTCLIKPNPDELQLLVNEIGFVQTGKKYGVSDNTIRNWIKSARKSCK